MNEFTIQVGSTEFLKIMPERDCYFSFEKGVPYSDRKRDMIWIKTADGHDLDLRLPNGHHSCPVALPRAIFDDFVRASLIRQDGREDTEHRIVFRLTQDGRKRGLSYCSRT
jgi:hypothetical protein